MNSAVELIHRFFSSFVDLVLWPVGRAGAEASLAFASVVFGILLLLVYGRVSNQKAIAKVKASINSSLLEAILFRHEPLLCLKAQGRMFGGGMKYFLTAVPPILILAAPSIFLLAQLNSRFGYTAAQAGEPVVVVVRAAEPKILESLSLQSDPGLEIVGPVKVPDEREAFFRLSARGAGQFQAALRGAGFETRLQVPVGVEPPSIEAGRYARWWMSMLYPAEGSLPAELEQVEVLYPTRSLSILGFKSSWLIHFLVISLLSGIAGSKFLGIQI